MEILIILILTIIYFKKDYKNNKQKLKKKKKITQTNANDTYPFHVILNRPDILWMEGIAHVAIVLKKEKTLGPGVA